MDEQFERTKMIIGEDGVSKLKKSKVVIFGIGGVGSYVAEGLARSGVSSFILVDNDIVDITNLNRQIIALYSTIGMKKTEVMKQRILDINPKASVECINEFYLPGVNEKLKIIDNSVSYVVDAIDTISAKIDIVLECEKYNVPVISSMGTGNKIDPTRFEVTDIYKTSVCPLAKVMRKELKDRGIKHLKVVYSKEENINLMEENVSKDKRVPGSISFVPSVAGLIIAGEVIKELVDITKKLT